LRGIFPIAQTPFTESNQLDLDALQKEVRFVDRCRAHGFVWPQMASEWMSLTERERLEGAEAIIKTGEKLQPAIVIGVQSPDVTTARRYAKHAESLGADAIISLPPSEQSDPQTDLEYYKAIGGATALPLFVQAVGNMSVDLLIEMYKAIPTFFRFVKDEAGNPLMSIAALRQIAPVVRPSPYYYGDYIRRGALDEVPGLHESISIQCGTTSVRVGDQQLCLGRPRQGRQPAGLPAARRVSEPRTSLCSHHLQDGG
jgi:dihydrodipicolinate synthase/N-acetylneuraminate lyase